MILLAEAPEDLPAIQGMLSAVGSGNLRDGALQRAAIDVTQLSATNPEKSVNEIVVAAELINKQIEAVQTDMLPL